jgi:hypothetical protein
MVSAQVGLWIDPTRALVVFAKSLTAHLIESRLLGPTLFFDNVIHTLGAPGPVLITGPGGTKAELSEHLELTARREGWVVSVEPSAATRDRDILAELANRLRPE